MSRWWFIGLVLVICNCSNNNGDSPNALPPKDLVTFNLPSIVTDAAPKAQKQFLELLPLNTNRYQMKVRWVLIDEDDPKILGPADITVTYLNSLFVAQYQDEKLVWSGAVAIAPNHNAVINGRHGQTIDLKSREGTLSLTLSSSENSPTEVSFREDVDTTGWTADQGDRWYYFFYAFPKELIQPLKLPGGRVLPSEKSENQTDQSID